MKGSKGGVDGRFEKKNSDLKKKNSGNGVLSSFTDGKATLDVVAIQYVDEEYTFPRTSLLKAANERESR